MLDDDLDSVLKKISRIADLEELAQKKSSMDDVVNMYVEDEGIFRKVFSWAGSIHTSLSADGRYHRDGCYLQPRMIDNIIRDTQAQRVLELCSGNGFNTIYLAKNNPQVRFEAIDLMPGHIKQSRQKSSSLANIRWQVGNVEQLDYPDQAFDLVYVIESLVHVPNPSKALSEAYRVLKPGGRMINFDCYLKHDLAELEPKQRTALRIDQNCVALLGLMQVKAFAAAAQDAGFKISILEELSDYALPDLRRLNRLVGLVFAIPRLTKVIVRSLPAEAKNGIIDCELLLALFKANLMGYYRMEFERL
jgi:SAM-dependent methyltransferase